MSKLRFSMLTDEWEVKKNRCFTAPLNRDQFEQTVIIGDQIKNGSISTDITLLEGIDSPNHPGKKGKEALVLFRYSGYEGYYFAGLGSFRTKFSIGKVLPGPVWLLLGSVGQDDSLHYKKTYHIRIECTGSQISLFENDVRQLTIVDEAYQIGQWGLRTWRTKAKFDNVKASLSKPVCFVVMPFASELDFIYRVIKKTVESYDMRCVRSDEIFVSRPVVEDLKVQIAESDLVIVDFTNKNPNVYYEAGLADAWKKKWIVLTQSPDDLTFDVRHIRTILYSNKMGADVKLRENLDQAIQETMGYRPVKD